MYGCRVAIGVLMILAAIAVLMGMLVIPALVDVPVLLEGIEQVLCDGDDQMTSERVQGRSRDGGTSFTAYYTCIRDNETTYDVTGKSFLYGGAGFTALLLLGLGFILIGKPNVPNPRELYREGQQAYTAVVTEWSQALPPEVQQALRARGIHIDVSGMAAGGEGDLAEKLQQLQTAYVQGLITRDEYERKRDEVLRQF